MKASADTARPRRASRVALFVAIVPVVAVLLLQIPPIRTAVVNRVLRAVGPWDDMELTVRETAGSVIWSLGLTDLSLVRADGTDAIRIDTVGIEWSLSALFRRRLQLDELQVRRALLTARRDTTGVIDLARPFLNGSDEPSAWSVRIGRFDLLDGAARMESDSAATWAADRVRVVVGDFVSGDDLRLRLDTLHADIADPGSMVPGVLDLRAGVSGGVATIDTLLFRTARSAVTGSGGLRLPDGDVPATDSLRFRFHADPLALADFAPLFPALNPDGVLQADVDVRGRGSDLEIQADGRIGDAGLVSLGFVTRIGRDSVTWSGHIDVDHVSPGGILAGRPDEESLSGSGRFQLSGPTRERLSGSVLLDVSATNLAGIAASSLSAEQTWHDGRADTRVAVQADRLEVRADGWMEPLAGEPAYFFELRTSGVEWDQGLPVHIALQATLRGSGLGLDADAGLRWRPVESTIGGCGVAGDGGTITLRGRRVTADAHVLHCGAPIRLAAELELTGARRWAIHSLDLLDVPLAPVDTVTGRLTAAITGSGVLDPSGAPRGTLRLDAGPVRWSAVEVDSVSATLSLGTPDWSLDFGGVLADGTFRGHASGEGSRMKLDQVAFVGIDVSELRGGGLPPSSLNGRATGTLDWSGPASGTFDIRLADSRVADQAIDSLGVTIDVRNGEGRLAGTADLHGGRIEADATFGMNPDSTWARVPGIRFSGIDLAAWTRSAVETDLTGSARGTYSSTATGYDARLDLLLDEGSRIRGVAVERALLAARARPDSIVGRFESRFEDGGHLVGDIRLAADSSYRFLVTADSLDAARLAFADTVASRVAGTVRAAGKGFSVETARSEVEAQLTGSLGSFEFGSLTAALRIVDGLLVVDTLRSHGGLGSVVFEGSIPLPGARTRSATDLRGTLDLQDLSALTRVTGIEDLATVESATRFRVRGSEHGLTVSATTETAGLVARRIHAASLSGTVSAELGPGWGLQAAEVRLGVRTLSLPSTTAEEAHVLATIRPDTVSVDADIRFTERRQARGSVLATDSLRHVAILSFEALLDDAEWALLAPADLELGDGFRLSGAVLEAEGQRIAVGGGFGAEDGNLYVTADAVQLDAVASLLGFPGLGMTVGGALTGTGTVDRPRLNGVIQAGITVNGRKSADVVIASALADQVLQVDARIGNASGGEAMVQGSLSLEGERIADAPVNLDIDADSLAVAWLLPFLDRDLVSDVGGRITGRIEVRGTFQEPDVAGRATLRSGRLGLPTLGRPRAPLRYTDIEADLAFDGQTVTVERASARSGPGSLHSSGTVRLEQLTFGRFALDVTSADFLAIDDGVYRAFAASDLRLSGTTRQPLLSGSVRITRGDFYMTDEKAAAALEPVELEPEDLLALEQRFGIRVTAEDTSQVTFYDLLTIEDLRLDFERDTWFRSRSNPKMDVRFTGSLDVQKAPRSEPVVFGSIHVVPEQSRIEQFGRRFDIERGELSFSGPVRAPDIDLAATYEVRSKGATREEVTIRLVATGRPENLRIDFESDPAMDLSDIISYIATGRPASSSLQFGGSGDGYLNTAAGLAMGPIAGVIEDVAGAGLGLDVVEIEHDGLNGLTLTAGKYVSPEFYVAVRQPISFASGTESNSAEQSSRTQVSMEYEVLREFLVSLLSRGAILRVQLRWEHSF